jgi:DNA-binding SARP family transcriptional activator
MKKTILLLYVVLNFINAGAQGLRFKSNNLSIDERTSYNVFHFINPIFNDYIQIEFKLSIQDLERFGYVLSFQNKGDSNIYSLTYLRNKNNNSFLKFNIEGVRNLVTIPLSTLQTESKKWIKINIRLSSNDSFLIIDEAKYKIKSENLKNLIEPQLKFGLHESMIDVPSFSINELKVFNDKDMYQFDFKEISGEKVHNSHGKPIGLVKNPEWLIKYSYHWNLKKQFEFKKPSVITYDKVNQRFLICSADSLTVHYPNSKLTKSYSYINDLPVKIRLAMCFYDPKENQLFLYEVNDIPKKMASIASLNLDSLKWEIHSYKTLPQQRHHHNLFLKIKENEFVIFGGFGNKKLTNSFDAYNQNTDTWHQLKFKGDTIIPRYFSGALTLSKDQGIIFGGIGNKSGDQSVGKNYFYDCYKVDFSSLEIKQLWNLERTDKIVSTRDMLLANDSMSFYTLSYPEYKHRSFLQLYRYTINDGSYDILCDSIPIISEEIRTNANLHFNETTNEIYTIVQEFNKDESNTIKIYSINAPPVTYNDIFNTQTNNSAFNFEKFGWLPALLLILFIGFIARRKSKKKTVQLQKIELLNKNQQTNIPGKNAILLFGSFTVISATGRDISSMFSPKIKQLFLLIFLNSFNENDPGVSSSKITSLIWPDKEDYGDAKNIRNVTINQLRKIFDDLEGISIDYEKNKFSVHISESIHCDFLLFRNSLRQLKNNTIDKKVLEKLWSIIASGSFLASEKDEFYDSLKKTHEDEVFDVIPEIIVREYKKKEYYNVIALTRIMQIIDPLNEVGLYYNIHSCIHLKDSKSAKKNYQNFIANYNNILDEVFPYTYREVSKNIPKGLI